MPPSGAEDDGNRETRGLSKNLDKTKDLTNFRLIRTVLRAISRTVLEGGVKNQWDGFHRIGVFINDLERQMLATPFFKSLILSKI